MTFSRCRVGLIRFACALAWFAGSCAIPAERAAAEQAATMSSEISLATKSYIRITLDKPISRVAIANPSIVEAKVIGHRALILLGKTAGHTSVLAWIEGTDTPKEYNVVVSTDLGPLRDALRADPNLTNVGVESVGQSVVLGGDVMTAEDHRNALNLARSFTDRVIDRLQVLQRQMVSVEVRVAAMSVSTLKRLGFDFSVFGKGFQVATTGPSSVNSFSFAPGTGLGIDSALPIRDAFNLLLAAPQVNFLSLLSALSGTSLAHILAEPTLMVRSGESADFISGGEIPIPVPQQQGAIGIEYRKFGIQLRIAATVLAPNRIALRVSPEVSDLDFSRAVSIGGTQVPAILTRGATTTIELGSGQSFVLAGLLSSTQSDSERRIPYLGDIPIVGAFFKRVDNARERQELVIVATPRLVRPIADANIPPPPGADTKGYNPSLSDILLDRESLEGQVVRHGLLP